MAQVITIDGPSASGKSSVSRNLAKKLGWNWVSTGAFYRGLAYAAQQSKTDLNDEAALEALCSSKLWSVRMHVENTQVFWQGQDVSKHLNREDVGAVASRISLLPRVRSALLQAQRDCSLVEPGLIAEGRDCGTVIFPQARNKFYLTADSVHRAVRRAQEVGANIAETQKAQAARDHRDENRKTAPMQVPVGAQVIDTSLMTLDQVVETIFHIVTQSSL